MKPASPCRGRYLIRHPVANGLFHCIDAALTLIRPLLIRKGAPPKKFSSILICNTAHLGDAVMTTALLSALKKEYPQIRIGVLIGSWSKPLLEGHPLIDEIHLLDHWKANRASLSFVTKYRHYYDSFKKALHELKEKRYEAAFDLNYHFPSSAYLLYRARIPCRTGYVTAGLSPLYTNPKSWVPHNQSTLEYSASLFDETLPLNRQNLKTILPDNLSFATFPLKKREYLVVHIGSGNSLKNWPLNYWKELLQKLSLDHTIVLTGHGEAESQDIAWLCNTIPSLKDFSNKLSLKELVCLIRNAKLLLGVDSLPGHIAAAVETPALLIYTGIYPHKQWAPYGLKGRVIRNPTACSPCFRSKGCSTMDCVQGVTPSYILQELEDLLT